jgi:hypothetical protein
VGIRRYAPDGLVPNDGSQNIIILIIIITLTITIMFIIIPL